MSTGVSPETRETTPRLHPSRRAIVKGAAWAAPVAAASVAAPAMAASPTQCAPVGTLFDAQARGRFLSGAIGGVNLDNVAAIEGAHAQAVAGTPIDTESAGLNVSVLNTLNLNLSGLAGTVSDVLDITTGQDAGVLNQYAYANEAAEGTNTAEIGAAGAVGDNSGAITLSEGDPNPPELGNINLYSLLQNLTGNSAVADLVDEIAGLDLVLGAIAARAEMDSLCVEPDVDQVERDYLIAYARLIVESNIVGSLLTTLTDGLNPTINISLTALTDALRSIPVLGPLLTSLARATGTATIEVDVDQIDDAPIPDDPNAALQVDLAGSTITLNLETLLDGGLNGQSPNTRLFVDAGVADGSIAELLDSWLDALIDRLTHLAAVNVNVRLAALGVPIADVVVSGSIADLLDGTGTATVSLLGGVGGTVDAGLVMGAVGNLARNTLAALFNQGGALTSALDGLNGTLDALFTVLQEVIRITVNAQNEATGTVPSYYQAITPAGRYDVAAIHLEALGALDLLNLSLARGSVGENTPR